jgi:hypothetical protein
VPLYEPNSHAPSVVAAERALGLLEADPGAAIGDRIFERGQRWDSRQGWIPASGLNEALDPLRHFTVEVRCEKCNERLGYAALHPDSARVVVANGRVKGRKHDGFYGLDNLAVSGGKTEGWAHDGDRGVGNVKTTAAKLGSRTGFPAQPIWTCAKCGATPNVTDATLLPLFLHAVANEQPLVRIV